MRDYVEGYNACKISKRVSMEIKLHHSFDEILAQDWNNLLASNPSNVPFLRYGYLRNWWEHRGGGEWPTANLNILSFWEDNLLKGIAPLFKTSQAGVQKLLILGSIEISDYLDFIYCPDSSGKFFRQMLVFLLNNPNLNKIPLVLNNIPENSPTISLLEKIGKDLGYSISTETAYHTPSIPLVQNWDQYLAKIDKKQRHEIRRKIRRAQEPAANIHWYLAEEQDTLNQEIEDFFFLMAQDHAKRNFLTEAMRAQMRSIIRWASHEKILHLSFLTVNGQKAAAYLCFNYLDRIWVYNSGFDARFSEFSPGWVLLSYLIQHAINNEKRIFDFMRGDEDYKYRFGAVDSFVMKVTLTA